MINRRTLLALVILVVLAGLYYLDAEHGKKEIHQRQEARRLFQAEPGQVDRLAVEVSPESADGAIPAESFVLEREGDRWWIVQPLRAAMEPGEVGRVVDRLGGELIDQTLEEPGEPEEYGLDRPELVVRWWKDGSEQPAIRLGHASPTGSMVFAQVEGREEIYGLDIGLRQDWRRKVDDLRDRRVMEIRQEDILGLEVETPEGQATLERRGEDWWLTRPLECRADADRVGTLLRTLDTLRVQLFVEDAPERPEIFELEPPLARLVVYSGEDRARRELQFGSNTPTDGVFCRRGESPGIFSIYREYRKDLLPPPQELRDPRVLRYERDAVARITLEGSHGRLELERVQDEWSLMGPATHRADRTAVTALLSDLEYLRAQSFPAEGEVGRPPEPSLTVELAADGEESRSWRLHLAPQPERDDLLAWSDPSGPFYRVDPSELERLDRSPVQLRDGLLLDLDRSRDEGIQIRAAGRELRLKRRGDDWKVSRPDDAGLDEQTVEDLVWALDFVEMERPATAKEIASTGLHLDPPRFEVTLRGPGSPRGLMVGAELPETDWVFARKADDQEVGLIRRAALADLLDCSFFAETPPS